MVAKLITKRENSMKSGNRLLAFVFSLFFVFGLFACQKRVITQPDAGKQGQQDQKDQKETKDKDQQPNDREKVSERQLDGKIDSAENPSSQYAESKDTLFSDILFEYDSYEVKETYKQTLQSVSVWMSKNSTARLSVEGHCDERGTNEYNLALGDRRAKAVKDYLSSLGVSSGRVDVISYGEEKPLCTEQSDNCWSKNRRAHFTVLVKVGK